MWASIVKHLPLSLFVGYTAAGVFTLMNWCNFPDYVPSVSRLHFQVTYSSRLFTLSAVLPRAKQE